MTNKAKQILIAVIGVWLTVHSFFNLVASQKIKISLFENGLAAAFIVEHMLALCHLLSIILFFLGIIVFLKAIFYLKGEPNVSQETYFDRKDA